MSLERTLKIWLVMLALTLALVACGGAAAPEAAVPEATDAPAIVAQAEEPTEVAEEPTEVVEQPAEEPVATVESETATSGDEGCQEGYRLFEHELLATDPVCIPADPQRVAFIDEMVGLTPVLGIDSVTRGTYFDLFSDDFPSAFSASEIESMVDIGHPRETNPETVLLAEPDLILSGNYWEDANKFLGDIAPTIIWNYDATPDWTAYLLGFGAVLNREAEAEQALAEIEERLAVLQEQVGDEARTYTVIRTMDESDNIQVFTTANFGAEHLQRLGFSMPDDVLTPEEAAEVNNAWWYPLSVEVLPTIDADHVFLLSGWEPEIQEEFLASPLWQSLEAVQNDRVHFINGEYWVRTHPIASHRVIDDLFTYVAEVDPAEVAPNPYAYTYEQSE